MTKEHNLIAEVSGRVELGTPTLSMNQPAKQEEQKTEQKEADDVQDKSGDED